VILTEPSEPGKTTLHEDLVVTKWDLWEVKIAREKKLKDLVKQLEETYKLKVIVLMINEAENVALDQENLDTTL